MMKNKILGFMQFLKNRHVALVEAVKVLSSMLLVFLVLVLIGPLTHAAQQIEFLF